MNVPQPDMPRMQMWFDFASPYSYLAIERIEDLAREAGVRVELRPFLLGPIFQAQGWNDTPFRLFPGKGAYMMRDIARLADKYGVIYRRPRLFPRMSVLPARIALMGQDESWGRDFCLAVFRANFQHDLDIQAEDVVHDLLRDLALDADALIGRAKTEAVRNRCAARSTAPAIWACSVRPPSSSATRCSGATTGSRMRWSGRSRALRPPAPRPASPRRPEAVQPLDGRATRLNKAASTAFSHPFSLAMKNSSSPLRGAPMPGGRSFTQFRAARIRRVAFQWKQSVRRCRAAGQAGAGGS